MFRKKEENKPFYEEADFWLAVLGIVTGIGILYFIFSNPKEDKTKIDDWKKKAKRAKKVYALKMLLD